MCMHKSSSQKLNVVWLLRADGGYYLFPECPGVATFKLLMLNTTDEEDDGITVSLMNWWYVANDVSV